jgi:hypothetical protein
MPDVLILKLTFLDFPLLNEAAAPAVRLSMARIVIKPKRK